MVIAADPDHPFLFIGERLCLDFVNTEPVDAGERRERLRSFDDLLDWCAQAGGVTSTEARELARRWAGQAEARQAHAAAVELRARLRALLERITAGRPAPPATIDAINDVLRLDRSERQLVRTRDGYAMARRRTIGEPVQLLVPVAESAAQLLSEDDVALVKACQNPECVLFFYDTTKNHARRWCSMAACGNRAKVAAHYQRAKQA
jgi:predicted RNA-binding Zn ribbon-like protein